MVVAGEKNANDDDAVADNNKRSISRQVVVIIMVITNDPYLGRVTILGGKLDTRIL